MKKTLAKILAPILVLSLVIAGVHFAVTGNNKASDTTYTFAVRDGGAILTGSAESLQGAVMLPAEIGGYPVTGIGEGAFKDCSLVTAFFLPDSITSVGAYAFQDCAGLQQAILPEGLVSIGAGAFWKCTSLRSVTLPISVTEIGSCAFYKCNALKSLIVPGSETPIKGIFNVALDIGQTLAVGNPARTALDPIVTTVYCFDGSAAYYHAIQDAYTDYVLLDDCTLTQYTVRYTDETDADLSPSVTVAFQPVGIQVAAVAAAVDTDDAQYPAEAVQVQTLAEGGNTITFVYPGAAVSAVELCAKEGSGAVLDREHMYIYGIEQNMSLQTLKDKYITVSGNGRIECNKLYSLGTGTVVKIYDNASGELLETWTLILFGDLDCDAIISPTDAIPIKGMVSGALPVTENPILAFAADMDNDGLVRMEDRSIVMGISSGAIQNFDQSTRKIV